MTAKSPPPEARPRPQHRRLRRPRFRPLPAPVLRQVHGLLPGDAGTPDGRHRQYGLSDYNSCHRTLPDLIEAVKRGISPPAACPSRSDHRSAWASRHLPDLDASTATSRDGYGSDAVGPSRWMRRCCWAAATRPFRPSSWPRPVGRHPGHPAGPGPMIDRPPYGVAPLRLHRLPAFLGPTTAPARIDGPTHRRIESRLATTAGTCGVMGPQSTMACVAEAFGMMPPGTAAVPAVHGERLRTAENTGAHAVGMIANPIRPSADHDTGAFDGERAPACCSRSAARPTR